MAIALNRKNVIKALSTLYKDDATLVYNDIEKTVASYKTKITKAKDTVDSNDVILITYGDNIKKEGQSHLQTLNNFVANYCKTGINSVHILPFYPYTSDDGFSITDYFKVDVNLGDWDAVSNLAENSNLMFDAVVNHISKSSNWFKSYLNEEEGFQDFFIDVDPNTDLSLVMRPRALPLLSPFTASNGDTKHIWTTFSDDQVDLNYASPKVFIAVLEVLLFYVSKGAKYIRLDAIGFLWKKIGTTCIHLEETHLIIQIYRKILDSLEANTILVSETNVPHQENISYFGNGLNEAHMVYNFTLPPLLAHSVQNQDVTVLTRWAQSLKLPSEEVCFFNFTASHDGVGVRPLQGIIPDYEINKLAEIAEKHGGFVTYKTNEDGSKSPYELNCNYMDLITDPKLPESDRIQRFLLTQSVMLCMPGVPGVYFHSLVGSQNDREGALQSGINRRINRKKLEYNQLEEALLQPASFRNNVYTNYSNLLTVRKQENCFNTFGKAKYYEQNGLFIIERIHNGEVVYAVHNFLNKTSEMPAIERDVIDILTNKALKTDTWSIPAYGFKWFK